jgi:hypothetical protein
LRLSQGKSSSRGISRRPELIIAAMDRGPDMDTTPQKVKTRMDREIIDGLMDELLDHMEYLDRRGVKKFEMNISDLIRLLLNDVDHEVLDRIRKALKVPKPKYKTFRANPKSKKSVTR